MGRMHIVRPISRKNWSGWALGVALVSAGIETVWCVMAARHGGGIDLGVYRSAAKGLMQGQAVYARGWVSSQRPERRWCGGQ